MVSVKLKGSPTRISGTLPKVGSQAPDFVLVDAELKNRSLSDFKGKKKILSFVPSVDTPVCSLSTEKFNQAATEHEDLAVVVISFDLPFAQNRFCNSKHLKHVIPLSLMRSKKQAENYGILIQEGPLEGLCARAVVVLDENNQVLYTELVDEITQEPNYEKAIEALGGKT